MQPHDHTHKGHEGHEGHKTTGSHGESCPAGALGSTNFMLALLVVLSLAFSITMIQKYRALKAQLSAMGLEVNDAGSVQAAQNTDPKAEERAKALDQLGNKLASLKVNMDEIEPLLEGLGVKVEAKKAAGPHGAH
ncbi:MAG: hypothetical protein ACE5KK_07960 [Candidatus Brocadiales bacterium]